jgi:RNA polymerase-binding transcription factor DksA
MALTPQQASEMRSLIEQRHAVLLAELRADVARVREDRYEDLAGPAPDSGDASVATLIADLDHADVGRDLGELRGLEAARNRLEAGSYGVCIDCGRDIEFARLRANPGAERDIECQTRYEKTYVGTRPPTL